MAVLETHLPGEILDTFRNGVDAFIDPNDSIRERLEGANPVGIRTFRLELNDILEERKPYPVTPTGWRIILAGPPGRVLAAGDVNERDGKFRLVSFSNNSKKDRALLETLGAVDENRIGGLEAVTREGDFELALLRIPGVLVDALLLISRSGGKNHLIAIRVPDNVLQPGLVFNADAFFSEVKALAKQFEKFNRVTSDNYPSAY